MTHLDNAYNWLTSNDCFLSVSVSTVSCEIFAIKYVDFCEILVRLSQSIGLLFFPVIIPFQIGEYSTYKVLPSIQDLGIFKIIEGTLVLTKADLTSSQCMSSMVISVWSFLMGKLPTRSTFAS